MDLTLSGFRWLWPFRRRTTATPSPVRPSSTPTDAPKRKRGRRTEEAARSERRADAEGPPLEAPAPDAEPCATGVERPQGRTARTYAREASALLLIATGLYVALALASFRTDPLRPDVVGENWVGPVGAVVASFFTGQIGVVSWFLPLECLLLSAPLLSDRPLRLGVIWASGDVVLAVTGAALLQIAGPDVRSFGGVPVGGVVGLLFGELLRGLFSEIGSYLVGLTVIGLILVQRAAFSFIEAAQGLRAWLGRLRGRLGHRLGNVAGAWQQARRLEREERRAGEPLIASPEQAEAIIAALADDGSATADAVGLLRWEVRGPSAEPTSSPVDALADSLAPTLRRAGAERLERSGPSTDRSPVTPTEAMAPHVTSPLPGAAARGAEQVERRACEPTAEPSVGSESETPSPTPSLGAGRTPDETRLILAAADAADPSQRNGSPDDVERHAESATGPSRRKSRRAKVDEGPTIVDTTQNARTDRSGKRRAVAAPITRHRLPTVDLLEPPRTCDVEIDRDGLRQTAELLEKTLADYGVTGKVLEILPGPTVTTFEVAPAPGTKVSKVAGLADDLALGLSRKVRIVAPIPGKNRVGFEVPNDERIPVNLRELIEDRRFLDMKAPLPCVLGRDIVGKPVFADLSSMPHVIVAGATGAGKSVGLAVMLVSLLYRRTPDELRLLLVDPKVVELAPFDRIPHLLLPVVTDMKQAANALKWAVDEMERRYQLFANVGTRNVSGYNQWVRRVREGKIDPGPSKEMLEAIAPDGSTVEVPPAADGRDTPPPEPLPFIVVVVDEFADLIMQQGKDVEAAVARLAQKARAAGIHVILATQRPSVDVITGMIKANFPTRIAYRVAQKVDSRTILDEQGAEHLLGKGDMLVKLNGASDIKRVQCPFCSEEEVQRVTDMLRAQGEPKYDESIVRARDEGEEGAAPEDAESDPLYDQAVRVVAETRRCSTSWIQRKLGIGYNRAAKIVETMERNQIVGPPNGSKEREILVSAF